MVERSPASDLRHVRAFVQHVCGDKAESGIDLFTPLVTDNSDEVPTGFLGPKKHASARANASHGRMGTVGLRGGQVERVSVEHVSVRPWIDSPRTCSGSGQKIAIQ